MKWASLVVVAWSACYVLKGFFSSSSCRQKFVGMQNSGVLTFDMYLCKILIWRIFFLCIVHKNIAQTCRSHIFLAHGPKTCFLLFLPCVSWPFSVLWSQRRVFWSLRHHVTSLNHSSLMICPPAVLHEGLHLSQAQWKVVSCFNEYIQPLRIQALCYFYCLTIIFCVNSICIVLWEFSKMISFGRLHFTVFWVIRVNNSKVSKLVDMECSTCIRP